MPKEGRALRWLCIYCNQFLKSVYVPADWKDGAEEKRTTQDDVERGFHLIVRPWNEAIGPLKTMTAEVLWVPHPSPDMRAPQLSFS